MHAYALHFRFNASESVSGSSQAKASVVRGIRTKLTQQYPLLADYINDIIPKKEPLHIVKWYAKGNLSKALSQGVMAEIDIACTVNLAVPVCDYYSHDHVEILTKKTELLFFRQRDSPYIPTLRLLHKCECTVCTCSSRLPRSGGVAIAPFSRPFLSPPLPSMQTQ